MSFCGGLAAGVCQPSPRTACGNAPRLAEAAAASGWTAIGDAISASFAPVTTYLTKSCALDGCTDCVSAPVVGDGLGDPDYDTFIPAGQRLGACAPWPAPCGSGAYQRTPTFTGATYGFAAGGTSNGMRFGQLDASGCRDNRCNQDLFYHPRTSVTLPRVRRFTLLARPTAEHRGGCRWQYAVRAQCGDDCTAALLVVLPDDPRQPPCLPCGVAGYNYNASNGGLQTGDQIYIPGEFGAYDVYLFIDSADVFRKEKSVLRGYSPVRRQADQVRKAPANSGLRNFVSHPSVNGLLLPF